MTLTLPVEAVAPERRGPGMGIYLACCYLGMTIAGPAGGWQHDTTGSPAAPIWFAGVMLVMVLLRLTILRVLQRAANAGH